MDKVIVSVVIPTFNRQDFIVKAIESLVKQTYGQFEIIVVDDCSTDNTQEVIRQLEEPRVVYVRHAHNKGAGEARNTGIEKARGKFVAFLDSDDFWHPTKLEKQLQVFEQDEAIGAVFTGIKKVAGDSVLSMTIPQVKGDILAELLTANVIDTTSSIMIKTELLKEVGGFDSSLPSCQDWDLYIRLAQLTLFDFVAEPLVLFNQHDGERITTNHLSVVEGHAQIYLQYASLALAISPKCFQRMSYTIGRTIIRAGIQMQNEGVIKIGRKILTDAKHQTAMNMKSIILYGITLVKKEWLLKIYVPFNKGRTAIEKLLYKVKQTSFEARRSN